MLIPVLTEPNFRSYLWAKQTMEGISQEATRRKYKFVFLEAEQYEMIDYDQLFREERRMLIVVGTSVSWMPKTLEFFNSRNIESIFISFDPAETSLPTGMVRMDYVGAIHHLLSYLTEDCHRQQIAMYAYNPNSSADNIKIRYFRRWCAEKGISPEERTFFNLADLKGCYRQFRQKANQFDAVICANDIAGVSLLSLLHEDGVQVPEKLYVTAFGDSQMAVRVHPSLTMATLDHRELGRQAVLLFSYLSKTPATSSLSSRVRSKLIVRESTGMIPDTTTDRFPHNDTDAFETSINFYSDPEAERLLSAETLLNACDSTDMHLLSGLLEGCSMDSLERKLYLTTSALHYRKKRLMNLVNCIHSSEFMEFLDYCHRKGIL
ncbi:MAG: LacI family DNA-binding transcriptional regulator [Clostridia bacterium]|nr:LacI family DNA-binding transcriptional regulator [Clostridia bacterium]